MGTGRQHSRDPGMQREVEGEGEEGSEEGSERVMECERGSERVTGKNDDNSSYQTS